MLAVATAENGFHVGYGHNWVNRGTKPCVIAAILVDAKPVEVGGKVLNAVW